MTVFQKMQIRNAKQQAEECKSFISDLVEEYEQKTELLANIISKPESARVEELKEQIEDIKKQKRDTEWKLVEGAYGEEVKGILNTYYDHLTAESKYSNLNLQDHKPTWVVEGTALGPYRCLECSCGAKLYDRSMI